MISVQNGEKPKGGQQAMVNLSAEFSVALYRLVLQAIFS